MKSIQVNPTTKVFYIGIKPVAEFDGRVIRKKVRRSQQFMRKYAGWGIDKEVLDECENAEEIRLKDTENEIIYTIPIKTAEEVWILDEFGDFGAQYFIPESAFTTNK